MSLEVKAGFLQELEAKLSPSVSAATLPGIMSTVSDVLEYYEFSRIIRKDVPFSMDLLDTWLSAMKIEGRSQKTIDSYSYLINRLLKDLQIPIRDITVYHLRSWLTKEKERGMSDVTLENDRRIFSSMFGWLWREGLIEKNPVCNIGTIKAEQKIKEPYTEIELDSLKTSCFSLRDSAIVAFLLATGCRVSEVVQLNREDINFQEKEVIVLGKGKKQRAVFFDDVTAVRLSQYLDSRTDQDPALFINRRKQRLNAGGIRFMLKNLGIAANVGHVHPHKFRRTLATSLIKHGMAIQEVAVILGHKKLDTTMRYVCMDKTTVKNSYHRYA